jgi:DNA-binding XRE family transcriptional regulator
MPSLKTLRLRKLLTQAELAEKAGICRDTANQVERGKQEPEIRTIRKLARALKVKPGEIRFTKK